MAEPNNTTPPAKAKSRTWLYVLGGGVALFFVGRAFGRRDDDDGLEALLAQHNDTPPASAVLAEQAAHTSSLSAQLYQLSRQLRE